jgi:hypothetical protein
VNIREESGFADVPATADASGSNGPPKRELPDIDNAADLLADETIALPPEIIKGVLHQGLKGVLGSNSKARKTWILLDAAVSVATGTPFWKWDTAKGRVIHINFEIPRAFIRSRIKRLAQVKGIADCDLDGLDVWTLRGHAAPLWRLVPTLIDKIQNGEYSLVIIDPIYKGLGGRDENSAGDVGQLCNEIEQIAVETKAAVLYAAHFSKGNQASKEAIDRIGGSGVWTRDADTIITLTKHEFENAYTVDLILRNLPEQAPFVVEWNFPLMCEAPHLDPNNLKQSAGRRRKYDPRKLLAVIADTSAEQPISISAWATDAGIPRQTLDGYLPEMRRNGWIVTVGDGSAARRYLTEKGKAYVKGTA